MMMFVDDVMHLGSPYDTYAKISPKMFKIYNDMQTLSILITDRFTQHRYKADQAFELNNAKSPVAAYLDIDTIVSLCVQNGVQAVHPGYGFLR